MMPPAMKMLKFGLSRAFLAMSVTASLPAANVIHYWDFDTQTVGVPVDTVGGVATSSSGTPDVSQDAIYGEAYAGAGASLNTALNGGGHLLADVYDGSAASAMIFTGSFSFSYWSYDASNLDGDVRGPRVFDSLSGTTAGIQLGSNASGIFNYRTDDDGGAFVLSNTTLGTLNQADGVWTHIAVNVDLDGDQAEVFFNGASQGTYDVSSLTGTVQPTQDMQIGVINGGTNAGGAQQSGLDDLAFYDGTLSNAEISGLASGSMTPDMIVVPEPSSALLVLMGVAFGIRRRRQAC